MSVAPDTVCEYQKNRLRHLDAHHGEISVPSVALFEVPTLAYVCSWKHLDTTLDAIGDGSVQNLKLTQP